jgi:thiamine-phosphate pyrophosphorylase
MIEHDDPRLRLCVVTDDLRDGVLGLVDRVRAAERGGASMVLLRLKHADARTLVEAGRSLVAAVGIPVLVSDRLDVALACGAAGVHLSVGSMPVVAVRSQLPASMLVGASVSVDRDVAFAREADFVTIGPVHGAGASSLGLGGLSRLTAACGRPALAIGGMDASQVPLVRAAGVSGVAVIGGVLAATDPALAAAALVRAF